MKKMTRQKKLEQDWKIFNSWLKKQREKPITLEEYNRYLHGKGLPQKKKPKADPLIRITESSKNIPTYDIPERNPYDIPSHKTKKKLKDSTAKKDRKEKQEISKNYPVAPAYNKGGYEVLLPSEIKNAGKKV